jgi:hypothetical protein
MTCCAELQNLADRELMHIGPIHTLRNGRIITEIDTEFFLAFGEERKTYVGMHYCPFCGRVVSREMWNREKKK